MKFLRLIIIVSIVLLFSSCKEIVSKGGKQLTKTASKQVVKKSTKKAVRELSETTSKRTAKGLLIDGAKESTSRSLRSLITSNKELKYLYESFSSKISKDFADDIIVENSKKGLTCMSKRFPNSTMKMSGNTILAKAGSTNNSGPVNEFLNHLLPNKTYFVDDGAFIYKTDNLGRVVEASSDRSKAFKNIKRNATRDKNTQKRIVESLDGHVGADDAGHLFANTTGGPNELINQVPMNAKLNRNGEWRKLERIEEDALKQGKKVVSSRKLIYEGNSKRPTAIEFITKIDGKETRTIIKNI